MYMFQSRILLKLMVLNIALSCSPILAAGATTIQLWESGAPGAPTKLQDEPTLFVYRPADTLITDAALIVCPGGGYGYLAMEEEGIGIAEWLNSFGITAFVLRYRHSGTGHHHPIPMLDGQRAIRTVRARSAEWSLDPQKIGVIGASAGGHLASTLGTKFDVGDASALDPIDRESSRPDFMILCYPVISFTAECAHAGSRDRLLGKQSNLEYMKELSNETQVSRHTPITFIVHTDEDTVVPAENSILFYQALREAHVPAELHIYRRGEHGVNLARDLPGTGDWPSSCKTWIESTVRPRSSH